jgi:hypothetical protein
VRADVWHEEVPPSSSGGLTLQYETLALPDEPEQQLVIYTAQADTESQTALDLLASLAAEHANVPAREPGASGSTPAEAALRPRVP